MVNKNNFVKLGLIRTFTMTNFAILLTCVCVRARTEVLHDESEVLHEYRAFIPFWAFSA